MMTEETVGRCSSQLIAICGTLLAGLGRDLIEASTTR
jgi:hypothetical protein